MFTKRVWALPLAEAHHYSMSNSVMHSKCVMEYSILSRTSTYSSHGAVNLLNLGITLSYTRWPSFPSVNMFLTTVMPSSVMMCTNTCFQLFVASVYKLCIAMSYSLGWPVNTLLTLPKGNLIQTEEVEGTHHCALAVCERYFHSYVPEQSFSLVPFFSGWWMVWNASKIHLECLVAGSLSYCSKFKQPRLSGSWMGWFWNPTPLEFSNDASLRHS